MTIFFLLVLLGSLAHAGDGGLEIREELVFVCEREIGNVYADLASVYRDENLICYCTKTIISDEYKRSLPLIADSEERQRLQDVAYIIDFYLYNINDNTLAREPALLCYANGKPIIAEDEDGVPPSPIPPEGTADRYVFDFIIPWFWLHENGIDVKPPNPPNIEP